MWSYQAFITAYVYQTLNGFMSVATGLLKLVLAILMLWVAVEYMQHFVVHIYLMNRDIEEHRFAEQIGMSAFPLFIFCLSMFWIHSTLYVFSQFRDRPFGLYVLKALIFLVKAKSHKNTHIDGILGNILYMHTLCNAETRLNIFISSNVWSLFLVRMPNTLSSVFFLCLFVIVTCSH